MQILSVHRVTVINIIIINLLNKNMLRLSPDKKKFEFEQVVCHSRLNQIGRNSLINRFSTINSQRLCQLKKKIQCLSPTNRQPYPTSQTSLMPKKQSMSHRHTRTVTEPVHDLIDPQMSPIVKKQKDLIRNMGLMGGIALKHVKYQGHIKIPTVYNDYHSASSNPGYSRKPDGGIYPK